MRGTRKAMTRTTRHRHNQSSNPQLEGEHTDYQVPPFPYNLRGYLLIYPVAEGSQTQEHYYTWRILHGRK